MNCLVPKTDLLLLWRCYLVLLYCMTLQLCCSPAFPTEPQLQASPILQLLPIPPFLHFLPLPAPPRPGGARQQLPALRLSQPGLAAPPSPGLLRSSRHVAAGPGERPETLRRPKCLQMCSRIGLGSQRRARFGEGVLLSRAAAALGQNQ